MDDNTAIFLREIKAHCERLDRYEFDYSVEIWGVWWMPCYAYIGNETLEFSIEIGSIDFKALAEAGKLVLIKDFALEELDSLEGLRYTYQLIQK